MAATTEFDVSNHGREQRVDERICSAFQLPDFTERGVDHERIAALDAGGAQLLEEHGGHATRSIVSCLMSAIRTETQWRRRYGCTPALNSYARYLLFTKPASAWFRPGLQPVC